MARDSQGESVLRKHLRVMDVFDAAHPFRTLTEISDVSGLALSTAHRVAVWDKFGWPDTKPDYGFSPETTWWQDSAKAAAIGKAD